MEHLSGSVAEAEIRRYLIDGEYFVPGAVGLQSLVPDDANEDDHQLHEIEFIGQELIQTGAAQPAKGFVNALRYAAHKGWFNG